MKIEEKFNKQSATLIDVQQPIVDSSAGNALGIKVKFFQVNKELETFDSRALAMHLTPLEALEFAQNLISAARENIAKAAKP